VSAKPGLTQRERECLTWVASGKTDREISEILSISPATVHKHINNSMRKLNATTRAHAVALAIALQELKL